MPGSMDYARAPDRRGREPAAPEPDRGSGPDRGDAERPARACPQGAGRRGLCRRGSAPAGWPLPDRPAGGSAPDPERAGAGAGLRHRLRGGRAGPPGGDRDPAGAGRGIATGSSRYSTTRRHNVRGHRRRRSDRWPSRPGTFRRDPAGRLARCSAPAGGTGSSPSSRTIGSDGASCLPACMASSASVRCCDAPEFRAWQAWPEKPSLPLVHHAVACTCCRTRQRSLNNLKCNHGQSR